MTEIQKVYQSLERVQKEKQMSFPFSELSVHWAITHSVHWYVRKDMSHKRTLYMLGRLEKKGTVACERRRGYCNIWQIVKPWKHMEAKK